MLIRHTVQTDSGLVQWVGRAVAVCVLAVSTSCTSMPDDPTARAAQANANDPLQPFNRTMLAFNTAVDGAVLKPAAQIYKGVVPDPARTAVGNVLDNLSEPITLMNDLLQGEFVRARETTVRFVFNSTIGLGGMIDFMGDVGISRHKEDFGQTLAVWGIPEGPYLVLPLLGPSNFRDLAGYGVDSFVDPVNRTFRGHDAKWAPYARTATDVVHTRSELLGQLEELERTSIDYYTTLRSVYRQRRQNAILNGEPAPADKLFGSDGSAGD
jgi:phospholipid-binding lipoprotein MlaA